MSPQYEYEAATDEEMISIEFLDRLAKKLGNPPDIDSQAGLTLLDGVIGVWQKHCPREVVDWAYDVRTDLANEKSLRELTSDKSAGYNPVGYPPTLFRFLKVMFPTMKLQERSVWKKMIKLYPGLFKTSNYA